MPVRESHARWQGDLKNGHGSMELGSGAFKGDYSFRSRFENGAGTNPEELLAAAHAGCFSMALANILAEGGHKAESVQTRADVHLELGPDGPRITRVDLHTVGKVPGMDAAEFRRQAETAKTGCPVSKLFAGADITLEAELQS